ncbi:MAG: hypothetical protein N2321_08340 [Melioribacteraceae bacterium]|nr:hypothetical protein [Melioribacteraceae bacterium]
MKKINILIVLILLQSVLIAGGGSIFSRYGLGDFRYAYSARRIGLGELGYSISDREFISNINPAAWNKIGLTRFESGIYVNALNYSSSQKSVFNSTTYFNGITLGFPIDRENGVSFVTGLTPYSLVSYQVLSSEKSSLVPEHSVTYIGEGGIQKLFFGSSVKLPLDFSVGASFDYYLGEINNNSDIVFSDTLGFHDATFKRQFSYHGIGLTAGLISGDISKLFGESSFKDFYIGFSFSPQVKLKADSSSTYISIIGTYAANSGSIKSNLPLRFGIGASFRITDNYLFTLDYMTQKMSQFELGNIKSKNLQDVSKFSFGVEYHPNAVFNDYWSLVMIRGAVSYEKTPYVFNGESINQFSVYAGCSLPLSYENSLDIAFQYGKRGTTNKNLIQENLYRLTFSLSFGELWFIQIER